MKRNNKKVGSEFEKSLSKYLYDLGYWVHFLNPAPDGSQPFDIIAMRETDVIAIDCKTSCSDRFSLDRIEDNQELAFSMLSDKGVRNLFFAVEHSNTVSFLPAMTLINLKRQGIKSVRIEEYSKWSYTYQAS